jgi:phytoene dehydrogenase-like protein
MLGPTIPEITGLSGIQPVRAAALDVGLDHLPDPSKAFILGIDQPLYLSVHSRAARLAPVGGALIHLVKYLPASQTDPEADRAELEDLLDGMQPGWRAVLCESQFLPAIKVCERLDLASDGGADSRPDTTVHQAPGLFLAGDWVRGGTWLSDAALASARQAATEAVQHARGRRAAA